MGTQPTAVDDLLDRGPGRRKGFVELAGGPSQAPVRLPLAVVTGTRAGPSAWINASLHGDEYLGLSAVLALLARLESEAMRGRVILTPALNPGAVRAMHRTDPAYPEDFNRVWVEGRGNATAHPAIPWAASVVLPRSDFVIDLHSGGNRFLQSPYAIFPEVGGAVDRESSALAKACGLPMVWAHRGSILEEALVTAAARKGKPAALVELEGEGKAEPQWIDRMVAAVEGTLAHVGILPATPRFLPSYDVFEGFTILRNREEGLWSRAVDPGARVAAGAPIGRVRDLLGQDLEHVLTPVEGVVVGVCTYGFVPGGDYVAEIASGFRREGPPA